jgi:acyl-CoA reductase-like NAD-dependent aldehyde dehydrogenase
MLRIHNPATGALLAEVPEAGDGIVAERAAAARAAQPGWFARPLRERMVVIERFRVALAAEVEPLAAALTAEVGKPIRQSRNEVNGLLGRIDFFLAQAEATLGEQALSDDGRTREVLSFDALGVVANISAWNYPYFVGGNVFVPALLAGNAVLYKPSEFATLSGLHIARLLHASGVPADVFVPLVGGWRVGAALLAQRIDGVFFTGSHATGQRIAAAVAGRFIKVQLELGGKDPAYVCDDADVQAAAESLADGAMYNTGQGCSSIERIYVHERIHDAFVEAFVAAVRGLVVDDPTREETTVGAITRAPQLAVLEAQVADALAKGAELLVGGRRLADRAGQWFEPTVLGRVDHGMALMRDESFGPIVGIQQVMNDGEALALMNDTRYGLTAGVYSRDEARARTLLARVNVGTAYWNCCDRVSARLPWSGHGDSGVGLTLSTLGLQTFTRPRAWHLRRP